MKKNMMLFVSLVGVLTVSSGLTGCAHSAHTRGSVALRHSAQEADVCLGKNEVKPGDKVELFKSECKPRKHGGKEGGESASCTKVKLGEGEVVQVLDDHYSTIRAGKGVSLEEGTIVEKL